MSMDQELAQIYGNAGAQNVTTEQEKAAQVVAAFEEFGKLAAEHNVNLAEPSPEEINNLWNHVYAAEPEAPAASSDAEAKLAEAAVLEHAERVEAQAKLAELDRSGRIMAHAFVSELREIEKAAAAEEDKKEEKKEEDKKEEKKKEEDKGTSGAPEGAPPFLSKDESEKKASAFDQFGFRAALKLAEAHNLDVEKVAQHINALHTLGKLPESEKVAYIQDPGQAVEVRGLEMLEAIGIEVDWDKVFGSGT